MQLVRFLLWASLLNLYRILPAQYPYTIRVNYPDPLPTRTVYDLFSDTSGLLWIGTDKGLYAFNGQTMKPIEAPDKLQNDISYIFHYQNQPITSMNFLNQIFFLNNDSLNLFKISDTLYKNYNFNKYAIFNNHLLILTSRNLFLVNKTGDIVKTLNSELESFYDLIIYNGVAFASGYEKVYTIDSNFSVQIYPSQFKKNNRFVIYQNRLLLAEIMNGRSVSIWNFTGFKNFANIPLDNNIFIFNHFATGEALWICTDKGAWKWDPFHGSASLVFPIPNVSCVAKDRQNNLWIASITDGLWKCPSLGITYYFLPQELYADCIFLPIKTKSNELHIFAKKTLQTYTISFSINTENPSNLPFLVKPFHNPLIHEFIKISFQKQKVNGMKKIIHYDQVLLVASSYSAAWINYKQLKPSDAQFGVHYDSSSSNEIKHVTYTIRMKRTYDAAIAKDKYWVAYADNLYEYDWNGNHKTLLYQEKPIIAKALASSFNETVYAASINKGILKIQNQQVLKQFNDNHFLQNYTFIKLHTTMNALWFMTDKVIGFIDFKKDSLHFLYNTTFIDLNNCIDFVVIENAIYILKNGSQIIKIDLDPSFHQVIPPKIYQTRWYVERGALRFDADAVNFHHPEFTRIYYKFSRTPSHEWNYTDGLKLNLNTEIASTGQKNIQFYVKDMLSQQQSPVLSLNINFPPAWYQTFWGMLLIVLCIAIPIYFFIQWRINVNLKKQKMKEELLYHQLKAIQSQMNPHFLYNILNAIRGMLYLNHADKAAETLIYFSEFSRAVLENSEKMFISLHDEIQLLNNYLQLEKTRFEDGNFEFSITQKNIENTNSFLIPSMLIQPFVENAIKHGLLHKKGKKLLKIDFLQEDNVVSVKIADNGIGREKAKHIQERSTISSAGFSIQAIQKRISLFHQTNLFHIQFFIEDLRDEQQNPAGTLVQLIIINKNA